MIPPITPIARMQPIASLPTPLPVVSPKTAAAAVSKAGERYPEGQGCPSQRNDSDPHDSTADMPRQVRDGHSTPIPVDVVDISEAGERGTWADEDPLW